ncbi:MAG TPA: response regulator [Anaerolineae bacterium]|nr:response regulator [Anaerolineae bacterium]
MTQEDQSIPSILVIDDNADHLELVRRTLTARGYRVLLAANAETGLQLALEQQPNVLVVDLGLPDIDGQTLIGQLRHMPQFATTPIIACTAWPEETARSMVEMYGCDDYISKPIRTADFADRIAAYLHR